MDYSSLSDDEMMALKKAKLQKRNQEQYSQQPSTLDKAVQFDQKNILGPMGKIMAPMEAYKQTPQYATSPQGMLEQIPAQASKLAGRAGQFVTEEMGRAGKNPYLAAGVGTAMGMAPDALMASAMIKNPAEIDIPKPPDAAISMGEHALGLSQRFRKTASARDAVSDAASSAFENGVIPYSGSPETMMERAIALERKGAEGMNKVFENAYDWKTGDWKEGKWPSGKSPIKDSPPNTAITPEEMGQSSARLTQNQKALPLKTPVMGKSTAMESAGNAAGDEAPGVKFPKGQRGPVFERSMEKDMKIVDPKQMIRSLEGMRPKYTGGPKSLYHADHAVIDTAIDTIKAHGDEPISLQEANALKSKIQSSVPYGQAGHELAKNAAAKVREIVDGSLEDLTNKIGDPKMLQQFKASKRMYGTSQKMQEGLNLRLAQKGNNIINPMSVLTGLTEYGMSGSPLKAAIAAGAGMIAKKAGTSISGNVLNEAANATRLYPGTSNALEALARRRAKR